MMHAMSMDDDEPRRKLKAWAGARGRFDHLAHVGRGVTIAAVKTLVLEVLGKDAQRDDLGGAGSSPAEDACTGLTARWCPVHGSCTCDRDVDLDDAACPLHGWRSTHPSL